MSDLHEHSHAHASPKKDDFSAYVLPLSILLAAVILSFSITSAADSLGTSLSGAAMVGDGNPLPPAGSGDGELVPSNVPVMAELMDNAAGVLGSDSAPVIMIEYSDYQCPFCRAWYNSSKDNIVQKYVDSGKVQLVFKDFPLSFHPLAAYTANAARCAADQGKFWEYHDKVFDEQNIADPSGGTVNYTQADVKQWGADLGLNTTQFNACADAETYAAEIQDNMSEGQAVGVTGTPSFLIGLRNAQGQVIVGAQPYATFDALLASLTN